MIEQPKNIKMEIILLPRRSDATEVQMGQYLFFNDQFINECDAISVTANSRGFTPLNTIAGVLGWERDMVNQFADVVNAREDVGINTRLTPALLLVPRVSNKLPQERLAEELFQACNAIKAKALRFTHYGLILGNFPEEQIKSILKYIVAHEDTLTLDKIYLDIDERFEQQIRGLGNNLGAPVAPVE